MHSDFSFKPVAIRLTLTIFLVPPQQNGFGPFSFKFFVPIRDSKEEKNEVINPV